MGLDLSVALITTQLSCRLNDTKDSAAGACLSVAEETAVRVDRQAAFDGGLTLEKSLAPFPASGEAEFFHLDDRDYGEAIVKLCEIYV